MIQTIVSVTVLVVLVLWVVVRARRYSAIYAPDHYVEFAESLAKSVRAACAKVGVPPIDPPTDDPRVFVTSAGIAVMYSVEIDEKGRHRHYYSLSIAGKYTPRAVGATFTLFVARLLDVDLAQLRVGVSQARVYHSVFWRPQSDSEHFRTRAIAIPSIDEARVIHAECLAAGRELPCESFVAG